LPSFLLLLPEAEPLRLELDARILSCWNKFK
jgi:hypothetical protein